VGEKIRGKLHYFGPWDDPDRALEKYLVEKEYLYSGRRPRASLGKPTVRDLCNRFLTTKRRLLDAGEIAARTFQEYHNVCKRIIDAFGKTRMVEDLAADDQGLIERPVRYGQGFKRPSRKTLRKAKTANGPR